MRTYHSLAAAVLAVGLAFTATAAQADAWDIAKANAEAYLEAQYPHVDNVTLVKPEFGNTTFKATGHLIVDVLFDGIFGGTIEYTPAKAAFDNFVDAGKGYSEPAQTRETMASCGPGHWFTQDVGGVTWCTPAHLVGKSGGSTYVGTTPAVERECEWTPNFRDTHSC